MDPSPRPLPGPLACPPSRPPSRPRSRPDGGGPGLAVPRVAARLLVVLALGGATVPSAPRAASAADAPVPVRRTVGIPLRDGATLAADVIAPDDGARRPAIVVQTPYGRGRLRPAWVVEDPEAYAFVVVDVRGRGGSRDAPPRPGVETRRADGHDVVEWVAAQPFCTGAVGTWGPSALGQQQFRTAEAVPPHLRCMVPVVSAFGWRHGSFHPGGVLREEYARTIDRLGFGAGPMIRAHPLDDLAWRLVERGAAPERVAVPTLMISGWYDLHAAEVPEDFARLVAGSAPAVRDAHRLLMGPWTHHVATSIADEGAPSGSAAGAGDGATATVARAAATAWFRRWLRGEPEAAPTPRVRYAVLGSFRWEAADAWPPPGVGTTTWFLTPDGLAPRPCAPATAEFRHDPAAPVPTVGGANLDPALGAGPRDQRRGVLGRADVIPFAGPPRTTPLALRGAVRLSLVVTVTPEGPAATGTLDADVHVRLCDVAPDGTAVLLADGARRVSSRDGLDRRAPVVAGARYALEVVLPDLAADVLPGHRLLVAVAGSNHPRYEVSPTPVRVELLLGGEDGCRLVLPTR